MQIKNINFAGFKHFSNKNTGCVVKRIFGIVKLTYYISNTEKRRNKYLSPNYNRNFIQVYVYNKLLQVGVLGISAMYLKADNTSRCYPLQILMTNCFDLIFAFVNLSYETWFIIY